MTLFHITWEIEIEADTPQEAVGKARRIQRDRDSIATVFDVRWQDGLVIGSTRIDLTFPPKRKKA